MTSVTATPSYSPLALDSRPLAIRVLAILVGTIILTLSSYVEVPMVPVPMTMQTLAVTLVGALYGWRLGGITIVAWLAEAAVGMPVLAGGAGGAAHFLGYTGGYLLAFPVVGALVGWLAERGWNGNRPVLAFVAALLGNLVCLAIGGTWLAVMIGTEAAWASGVAPFVLGGVLKSVLAAAILAALARGLSGKAAA